jgi:hypothetical protein
MFAQYHLKYDIQKAHTLLADHLFSPALYLAERIERGLVPAKSRTGVSSITIHSSHI